MGAASRSPFLRSARASAFDVVKVSEHALQLQVTRELELRMPRDVPFTAVDHAAKLSARQAGDRKRRGVKRGQADYRFVLPPMGRSAEIELKIPKTYQSPEQKAWAEALTSAGALYAVCRSMAEVEGVLAGWGVKLKGEATA